MSAQPAMRYTYRVVRTTEARRAIGGGRRTFYTYTARENGRCGAELECTSTSDSAALLALRDRIASEWPAGGRELV